MGARRPRTHAGDHLSDAPTATAIYVAYRTPALDLSWVPPDAPVVVVHNDRSLPAERCDHPLVRHVFNDGNVGFGAAVNAALPLVETGRVVLANPDTALTADHWAALTEAAEHEVVVVPLRDSAGRATSVVSRYPTPASLLLTAWRAGRLVPRGTARRVLAAPLGRWGRAHGDSLTADEGEWPLAEWWASGAVVSVDAERLRAVGGFDPAYFLYMEDVDLGRRLSGRFPDMVVRLVAVPAGRHAVGGSAAAPAARRTADRLYAQSALRYATSNRGTGWRISGVGVRARLAWLRLRGARDGS